MGWRFVVFSCPVSFFTTHKKYALHNKLNMPLPSCLVDSGAVVLRLHVTHAHTKWMFLHLPPNASSVLRWSAIDSAVSGAWRCGWLNCSPHSSKRAAMVGRIVAMWA
jgi:hypothetical protein